MKIKDILNESTLINDHGIDIPDDIDLKYNPESYKFSQDVKNYYKKFFDSYVKNGVVPLFDKTDNTSEVGVNTSKWSNKPKKSDMQTPGYRGQQNALDRANLPHDKHVDEYDEDKIYTSRLRSEFGI